MTHPRLKSHMKLDPLEFVELPRGEFFDNHHGYSPEWWDYRLAFGDRLVRFSVRLEGNEVARVELDRQVHFDHYLGVPEIDEPLEVQFLEVNSAMRRRGYGRRVVQHLRAAHPEKRLVAFSEEADDFWSGIGWSRFDHPEGSRWQRPLFVAPLR